MLWFQVSEFHRILVLIDMATGIPPTGEETLKGDFETGANVATAEKEL